MRRNGTEHDLRKICIVHCALYSACDVTVEHSDSKKVTVTKQRDQKVLPKKRHVHLHNSVYLTKNNLPILKSRMLNAGINFSCILKSNNHELELDA